MQLTLHFLGIEVFSFYLGPPTEAETFDHEVAHYTVAGFRVDEAAHIPNRGQPWEPDENP